MISVVNLSDVNCDLYDEVWAVVRSMKYKKDMRIKQVTELSPSYELFMKYINLRKSNNWNRTSFNEIYVPQFLYEMTELCKAHKSNKLQELFEASTDNSKNICISCYCKDLDLCHASILAGIMQYLGGNVNISKDYSFYGQRWITM